MTDTQATDCEHPGRTPLSAYQAGCRCDRCTTEHRRYHREYARKHADRYRKGGKYWRPSKPSPRKHTVSRPVVSANGYIEWYMPDHPLAMSTGRVYAHRWTMWWKTGGLRPARCEICYKPFDSWSDIDVHHRNADKQDNRPENLQATCHRCNIIQQPHFINGDGVWPNKWT